MRTVLGLDQAGKPIFSKRGGLSLLNDTQGVNTASFGYTRAIDTLTYIKSQITEQTFYKVNIMDYLPVCSKHFDKHYLLNFRKFFGRYH